MEKLKCLRFIGMPLLLLCPVLLFYIYIWQYAVNIPYMDDADLVDVVNHSQSGFREFLAILFRQQNDHRVFFSRLGVLIPFWITGSIDFRLTILVGYINLIGLGYSIFLVFRSFEPRLWYFLPVSLLLFSPIVYQVHLWSITAYQYTLSIAFSIGALYFLQKDLSRWWSLSIPFSMAASLTNLDGLGTLPVAFIWLLLQGRRRVAGYYLIFLLAYGTLFFVDFKLSGASQLSFGMEGWLSLFKSIVAITGSLGKVISDTYALSLAMILGAAILLLYLSLKIWDLMGSNLAILSKRNFLEIDLVEICFLRVLASAAMIAIGRHMDGIENMLAIRFQIYSVSLVILFYLYILSRVELGRRVYVGSLTLGIAMFIGGYSYLKYSSAVDYYRAGLVADSYNFTARKLFLHQYFNLPDPQPWFYGHYRFPAYYNTAVFEKWSREEDTMRVLRKEDLKIVKIQNEAQYKHYIYPVLQFGLENIPDSVHTKEAYLMLTSTTQKQESYLMALRPEGPRILFWGREGTVKLVGEIPDKIPSTAYNLNLCWKAGDSTYVRAVGRNVSL
ncbi:hypothetical protein [Dyadobacter tibetensis]|uniref:hypothetical protein n=1 Tax=Dyadobacter tibetensis TaxID=1211851 RepID=UPI00103F3B75|nr:hypothetical protein [Dyadobacter tibetensis]